MLEAYWPKLTKALKISCATYTAVDPRQIDEVRSVMDYSVHLCNSILEYHQRYSISPCKMPRGSIETLFRDARAVWCGHLRCSRKGKDCSVNMYEKTMEFILLVSFEMRD